MRRPLVAALVAALSLSFLSPLTSSFAATAKVGAKCSKVGAKATASGKQLVCAANKKWALVKTTPAPAPKPTPTPTPTPTAISDPKNPALPPINYITRPAEEPIKRVMQRVALNESCHAQVSASLQRMENDVWVNIANAEGWDRIPGCSDGNPYRPWANASVAVGERLRWRVFSPGNWEWFSSAITFAGPSAQLKPVPVATKSDAPLTDFAAVALKARDSVLLTPVFDKLNPFTIKYEDSIPDKNRVFINASITSAMRYFSYFFPSNYVLNVVVFQSSKWGLDNTTAVEPNNSQLLADMTNQFKTWGDRSPKDCVGSGGFAVTYLTNGLLAIDAPCTKWDDAMYSVPTHELTHAVQFKYSSVMGFSCYTPTWLTEGQAQVGGYATSTDGGMSKWYQSRAFSMRNMRNPDIDPLKLAEENYELMQYTNGAAAMEYLVARSGWQNSMDILRENNRLSALNGCGGDRMDNFKQAFKNVYGQTLDQFYDEVLLYLRWVYNNRASL